jgi:hypothetical protein
MHDEDDSSQSNISSFALASTDNTRNTHQTSNVSTPQEIPRNPDGTLVSNQISSMVIPAFPEFILRNLIFNTPLSPYEASIASLFLSHHNIIFEITQFQEILNAIRSRVNEEYSSSSLGLDTRQLNRLPTFSYKKAKSGKSEEKDIKCTVCYCDFEESDQLKMLPCFHKFHVGCIDPWLKQHTVCPICKDDLSDYI